MTGCRFMVALMVLAGCSGTPRCPEVELPVRPWSGGEPVEGTIQGRFSLDFGDGGLEGTFDSTWLPPTEDVAAQ